MALGFPSSAPGVFWGHGVSPNTGCRAHAVAQDRLSGPGLLCRLNSAPVKGFEGRGQQKPLTHHLPRGAMQRPEQCNAIPSLSSRASVAGLQVVGNTSSQGESGELPAPRLLPFMSALPSFHISPFPDRARTMNLSKRAVRTRCSQRAERRECQGQWPRLLELVCLPSGLLPACGDSGCGPSSAFSKPDPRRRLSSPCGPSPGVH